MNVRRTRTGTTLVEIALFMGIVAILSTTIVQVYIALTEVRLRQEYIAEVEQRGTQILSTMTKSVRNSEKILTPSTGGTATILGLQMPTANENPTIFLPASDGEVLLIQRTMTSALLGGKAVMSGLQFTNIADEAIIVSFDMQTVIPTLPKTTYVQHFSAAATLYPKRSTNAGCNSCDPPLCTAGSLLWYYCDSGICTAAGKHIACSD